MEITVNSPETLNILVAKTLGYVKSVKYKNHPGSDVINEIECWIPWGLPEEEETDWLDHYGVAPDFCRNYENTKSILNFLANTHRTVLVTFTYDFTQCEIKPYGFTDHLPFGIGKALGLNIELAICLSWLSMHQIRVNISPDFYLN
jgi:hypothetical protein